MNKKTGIIAAIVVIVVVIAGVAIGVTYLNSNKAPAKEVVIYADYGSSLASKYFDNFTNATGIKVVATYGSMGDLEGKLIADSASPQADILFGGAPSAYISAESHGIFQSYTPAAIANQSEYLHGGLWRSANWTWYPFTYAVLGLSINTHNLPNNEIPTSFLNLTNPIYKGKIILENPSTSTTTGLAFYSLVYQYYMQKADNNTATAQSNFKTYMSALMNNSANPIQSDDENAEVALGQSSSAAITIDWTYMPSLYHSEDGYTLSPDLLNSTVLGPTAMSIVKGAPHMTYAEDFVNWVLSTQGQQNITAIFHKPPIIAGIPIPAGSFSIAQVQKDIFPYNQTFTTNNANYISGLFTNLSASTSVITGYIPQSPFSSGVTQNNFIDTSLSMIYQKAYDLNEV